MTGIPSGLPAHSHAMVCRSDTDNIPVSYGSIFGYKTSSIDSEPIPHRTTDENTDDVAFDGFFDASPRMAMKQATDVFNDWAHRGKDEGMERGHGPAVEKC